MNHKYIVIDFETTGPNPKEDRIIQIGAVLIEGNQITKTFSSFVNPHCTIPTFIKGLTGITDEMVVDAPDLEDVLPHLLPMLDGARLVAHNVSFDLSFLQNALQSNGYHTFSGYVMDTIELGRMVSPMSDSFQLSLLAAELHISHDRPHQADSDALVTAEIFLRLLDRLGELPLVVIQRLLGFSQRLVSDINILLHEVEQSLLTHAEVDNNFDIYRHYALQYRTKQVDASTDKIDWNVETFIKDKRLQNNWDNFEIRPAQETMMKAVSESFENDEHLLVEAGTGTGKSLAYLLPAIHWARQNDTSIIISTHTINLQQQLFERDIPLLQSILPDSFEASILKGRSNYLCLRKFEQRTLQTEDIQNSDEAVSISQLVVWVAKTHTGDVEELNFNPKGREVWKQVSSHADSCLNRACPWFSRCFYHRARNRAQQADIVITNHSLLFTDLKADHRILPSYDYVIIDEAHQLEDVASKHLGAELHFGQIISIINRLQKDTYYGQLIKLSKVLSENQDDKISALSETLTSIIPKTFQLRKDTEELFHTLYGIIASTSSDKSDQGRQVYRMNDSVKSRKGWIDWIIQRNNWIETCIELSKQLSDVLKSMNDHELPLELKGIVTDVSGLASELHSYPNLLLFLTDSKEEGYVFWIEVERNRHFLGVYLFGVPIEVGEQLKTRFFDEKASVILTSATLTVNKSFDYVIKRIGLANSEKTKALSLLSPFNYNEQAMVYVPSDFPNIKDVNDQQFIQALAQSLAAAAIATKGRMLVLFTSFHMLRQVYELLSENLKPHQINVLGHGVESSSRSKLTTMFKNAESAVLLGTNSFWEGVDIPGEDLSCLAIVRLPFWPPNHPVVEARNEKLQKEGKNAFMELSVPQAVVRFKQGFGRLIRSKRDRGVVIVYDRRIIDARYGKVFLDSLPDILVTKQPTSALQGTLSTWLDKNKATNK